MQKNRAEIDRIKDVYKQRREIFPNKYSYFNKANLFVVQRREWEIIRMLKKHKITFLKNTRILDVGCGIGNELRSFIKYGASPENLFGIDMVESRINKAKKLSPNINYKCQDASLLPYKDEDFDIITQFTVFTSILDTDMKTQIAKEILRVLKSNGIIIWYDFHINNPRNKNTRRINKKELCLLFPNCDINLKSITLAPPLTRTLAPISTILCQLLEKIPLLCTHYIGTIQKR